VSDTPEAIGDGVTHRAKAIEARPVGLDILFIERGFIKITAHPN
jgi:hypothetical protein